MTVCTRCEGTGFLNLHQVDEETLRRFDDLGEVQVLLDWIASHENHDVSVCDCCGDGEGWYGEPGHHYSSMDPPGNAGPYASNGGLCKCH